RRAMRRFSIKLPVSVRVCGVPYDFPAQIQNISARGLFFYIERWMSAGKRVEVTMNFPPQVTLADSAKVKFLAVVLRVETQTRTEYAGVAALIEEYEFLGSAGEGHGSTELEHSNR
ncbi:MAG: PilZ domain-containing protein, partial [Acidobacteria bacterium]|nr:PilZ domain-containing protein [Acidobacteriota bacterium]